MKCSVCNTDSNHVFLCANGMACSEDCAQILKGKLQAEYAALRQESIKDMPDKFEVHDFEKWTLKISLHILDNATAEVRKKLKENNPIMLQPDQLALELKDKILNHIPHQYVSSAEEKGHMRMFFGGTYMFQQPVPAAIIVQAARKAAILQ